MWCRGLTLGEPSTVLSWISFPGVLVGLFGSVSSIGLQYGLITVVWNGVGPLGSAIVHVSLSILRSLYGPVYLPAYPVFPSCHMSTSEFSGSV